VAHVDHVFGDFTDAASGRRVERVAVGGLDNPPTLLTDDPSPDLLDGRIGRREEGGVGLEVPEVVSKPCSVPVAKLSRQGGEVWKGEALHVTGYDVRRGIFGGR
jgi:hypothetical protein